MHVFWTVLYYGILASVTGGWLPVRKKNAWLIVFHLFLMLTFLAFPLAVFFVNATHWAGWFVYSFYILFSFVVLKIVNLRLHRSLGNDPVPEEEEANKSSNGESNENGKDSDKDSETKTDEKSKEKELENEKAEDQDDHSDLQEDEEHLQRHRDSASTFQSSTNGGGTNWSTKLSTSVELSVTVVKGEGGGEGGSEEVGTTVVSVEPAAGGDVTIAEVETTDTSQSTGGGDDGGLSVEEEASAAGSTSEAKRGSLLQPPTQESLSAALMSPVHRSNSNLQGGGSSTDNYLSVLASFSADGHLDADEEKGSTASGGGIQRSISMPPSMFETNEDGTTQRDRVRAGICIQRNRGSSASSRGRQNSSQSDNQLEESTASGGGGGGAPGASVESSLELSGGPRTRRNAVRDRRGRRAYSTDESVRHRPPSPVVNYRLGDPSTGTITEEEDPLLEKVRTKLFEDNRFSLMDVVEKMPHMLHEAIGRDEVTASCFETLLSRVEQLRQGHLASGEEDSTPGAIHWFEVSGEWDFYVFQPDEDEDEDEEEEEEEDAGGVGRGEGGGDADTPLPSQGGRARDLEYLLSNLEGMDPLHQEILLRYGNLDELAFAAGFSPPNPPPRPSRGAVGGGADAGGEEERPPTYEIIPRIKKTAVPLKFARRDLEEFMDRNVTGVEASATVLMALLVCVVAALLLSLVDFYQGFWAAWFCFVVATAHFSLVKSVQDDPASPSPGQNHITALSRAFYFIVVGVLALCIDAALSHLTHFPALCVYGFNVNSQAVLFFVRNGLLILILFFPVLFALGWLPQADTFTIYLLEQFDMHIFGGTPATGLLCAFYAVARSLLTAALLYPLGYAAFYRLEGTGQRLNCSSEDTLPNTPPDCEVTDRVALSFFLGAVFALGFCLSRSTSSHQFLWDLLGRMWQRCRSCVSRKPPQQHLLATFEDPLEKIYCDTLRRRMCSDLVAGVFVLVVITALSLSTLFCRSNIPAYVVYGLTCVLGLLHHYVLHHIRKEMPWLLCSEPIIKPSEWESFEVSDTPKLSVLERIVQWTLFIEKNVLYPLSFLFALQLSAHHYKARFNDFGAAAVVTVVGLKLTRSSYTELSRQHLVLIFTLFFFSFDYAHLSEGLPLDYFIIAILFNKFYDLLLKMYFIYIYIAPWQTSWSSPGHIITQPLLVPHTPVIFLQTLIGAVMGAPINPVFASTFFLLSYVRPVKYWEKNYNTKRSDSSNTRLDSQLEGNLRNPNPDRLDSLFYEHLTWVLQKSLCGDLLLGRWGRVTKGDFFILTSDRLNALVHIIEFGNGFVTFQLRGLEFRGTYCHQREVEAITETVADDEGCCCNEPGHLPYMLSCNKAFTSRWLAWEVVSSCYTLHGYSISENQAHLVFNSFDYKKSYITYYCKCIIYKLLSSPRFSSLLENPQIQSALEPQHNPSYVDLDPLFDESRNCDYSHASVGIQRERFVASFQAFIEVCIRQEGLQIECEPESFVVTLCFAYCLLGRRMFFQHAQAGTGRRSSSDNFMNGLYRMFLGDARPHSPNDEWVFNDVDSIQEMIIPAARIALKVHQDNFTFSEEYESAIGVFEAIKDVEENHVVTHENDRAWRTAVVMNKPSLLALRYQRTEDSYIYPYKLIRLSSKFIKFRIVKMNRECVRSLWTSQQHELIYLRNNDSERGSIQNHKPTLRNMVNSSMDLPIGYPIYVSPLTTSYIDRHETYNDTFISKASSPMQYLKAARVLKGWCDSCAKSIRGSRGQAAAKESTRGNVEATSEQQQQQTGSIDSLTGMRYGIDGNQSYEDPFPDSDSDTEEQLWKPMWVSKTVVITDASQVFDNFNISWLKWPNQQLARKAMKSHWKAWRPQESMEGEVVNEWRPFHKDALQRSHIDKVILLVKMTEDLYVLIKEQGVKEVLNGQS